MSDNLVTLFLEFLKAEKNLAENTIVSYRFDLDDFCLFISLENKNLRTASSIDINAYLENLNQKNLSVATKQRKLSALRQFYQFLVDEEIIEENPTEKILRPKSHRPIPKIITQKQVKDLFAATDNLDGDNRIRVKLILLLLYGSGLRVSELISLKKNSFNGQFLRIFGKGSKERTVPIASQLLEMLNEVIKLSNGSEWIFPSRKGGHITRQWVSQILKNLAIEADIPASSLSPHVLRHAFATHILDNGGNLISIKKMLGHKSISTTEIYTHVSKAKLKEVINTKHPLNKIIHDS